MSIKSVSFSIKGTRSMINQGGTPNVLALLPFFNVLQAAACKYDVYIPSMASLLHY